MNKKLVYGIIGFGIVAVIVLVIALQVISHRLSTQIEQELNVFLQESAQNQDSAIIDFEPFHCFGMSSITCEGKSIRFGFKDTLNDVQSDDDINTFVNTQEQGSLENIRIHLSGHDTKANINIQTLIKSTGITFDAQCENTFTLKKSSQELSSELACQTTNEEFAYNQDTKLGITFFHEEFFNKTLKDAFFLFKNNDAESLKKLGIRLDSFASSLKADNLQRAILKAVGEEGNTQNLSMLTFMSMMFINMLEKDEQKQTDEEIKELDRNLVKFFNNLMDVLNGTSHSLELIVSTKTQVDPILLPDIEQTVTQEWIAKNYSFHTHQNAKP